MRNRAEAVRTLFGVLVLAFAGTTAGGMLTGCGVAPKVTCTLTQAVLPATATADHTAASPGDQQGFDVGFLTPPPGCAVPQLVLSPQDFVWVSSDPINAPISNAKDATAGIATCGGATIATISTSPASYPPATLTCK